MSIENAFRRVVAAAGLDAKQVVRHTLRHTAITHLVQAGVDLPTVQRISGHKTLQMVVRYSYQNGEHIQAARDKLASVTDPQAGSFCVHDYTGITHGQRERTLIIMHALDFIVGPVGLEPTTKGFVPFSKMNMHLIK
jgi:hypothetical protein